MSYKCATCGKEHLDLPDIGFEKPDPWFAIPENERTARTQLTADTCIINDEEYFIRAVLLLPVIGYSHDFGLGIWVSQKRENFFTYLDNYDSAEIGPFFGWLSTEIGYYKESTYLLKTMVHFRGGNSRPIVELEPTEHPLSVAQRTGISFNEALEIVHYYNGE